MTALTADVLAYPKREKTFYGVLSFEREAFKGAISFQHWATLFHRPLIFNDILNFSVHYPDTSRTVWPCIQVLRILESKRARFWDNDLFRVWIVANIISDKVEVCHCFGRSCTFKLHFSASRQDVGGCRFGVAGQGSGTDQEAQRKNKVR